MKLFIQVFFWVYLVGAFLKMVCIAISKYPRSEERSLGYDLMTLMETVVFVAWAGILLFGGAL